jgi:hypothetical protein
LKILMPKCKFVRKMIVPLQQKRNNTK